MGEWEGGHFGSSRLSRIDSRSVSEEVRNRTFLSFGLCVVERSRSSTQTGRRDVWSRHLSLGDLVFETLVYREQTDGLYVIHELFMNNLFTYLF